YIAITPSTPDDDFAPGLPVDHDLVLEMRRSSADLADGAPVRTLLDVPPAQVALGNIHNANTVRFGPDGMLYVGMGDGGGENCADAEDDAPQNVARPFGKILRLDLKRAAPYAAGDNPFTNIVGGETVLHYGLRNPFRFSFDRENGAL